MLIHLKKALISLLFILTFFLGCLIYPTIEINGAMEAFENSKKAEVNLYAEDAFKIAETAVIKLKKGIMSFENKDKSVNIFDLRNMANDVLSAVKIANEIAEKNKSLIIKDANQVIIRVENLIKSNEKLLRKITVLKIINFNIDRFNQEIYQHKLKLIEIKNQLESNNLKNVMKNAIDLQNNVFNINEDLLKKINLN